jgi:hypothetical protein
LKKAALPVASFYGIILSKESKWTSVHVWNCFLTGSDEMCLISSLRGAQYALFAALVCFVPQSAKRVFREGETFLR